MGRLFAGCIGIRINKTAIEKENTYADIADEEEFFAHMRFAMESLCFNIIQLTKDKENSRKYWSTTDNVTERLLQMNHDVFKPIFMLMHKWHFGYVYENDLDYQHHIKDIVRRLRLYHGIKQTDFYKLFSWDTEVLMSALREADKDGVVLREKKGNTYLLFLPKENKIAVCTKADGMRAGEDSVWRD